MLKFNVWFVINYLSWIITFLPFITITIFMTFGLHIRFFLGRWPVVFRDNPESILITIHTWITIIFLAALYFSLPLWIILMIALAFKANKLPLNSKLVIYSLGWASWFFIHYYDPFGFFEWFWD